MMNLYQYLDSIKAGKAINAKRFIAMLDKEGLSVESLGAIEHIKQDKYRVHVANSDLLAEWINRYAPVTSRIDASLRSADSHLHVTAAAYFVCKRIDGDGGEGVIKCTKLEASIQLSRTWNRNAVVLVENSDCLTFSDAFIANMGMHTLREDTLIIWSSGKAITHPNTTVFLRQFRHVYYCPDYDLVGIEIYETLTKRIGKRIHFMMPDNLADYYSFCHPPAIQTHYTKALHKAEYHGFTPMVELLIKGKGVLEQEVLIGEEQ